MSISVSAPSITNAVYTRSAFRVSTSPFPLVKRMRLEANQGEGVSQ